MALDQFYFGQLLHLLNDEHLKYKIQSVEKVNKQISNIKSGIKFNNTCISEGSTQIIYVYIYILLYMCIYSTLKFFYCSSRFGSILLHFSIVQTCKVSFQYYGNIS